jgi:tRNA(fMet)-specific endonuclease VapC
MNPGERPVLLDTNVLMHLLRADETGQRIEEEHRLASRSLRPLLSVVVEAEIKAIARRNEWGTQRLDDLTGLLRELVPVGIRHPTVVDAYAGLYCRAHEVGRYRQFRQNDLWIAATGVAAGATLYTCDGKDFDWIDAADLPVVVIDT